MIAWKSRPIILWDAGVWGARKAMKTPISPCSTKSARQSCLEPLQQREQRLFLLHHRLRGGTALLLLQDWDEDENWCCREPCWAEWGVWVSKGSAVFARLARMCCSLCGEVWQTSVSGSSEMSQERGKCTVKKKQKKKLRSNVSYLWLPFSWEEKVK